MTTLAQAEAATLAPEQRQAIAAYFGPRAAAVDRADADIRDGLRWLNEQGLLTLGLGASRQAGAARAELLQFGEVVATIAEHCMASAFTLWCHRMVLEYLWRADQPTFPRAEMLDRLSRVELLGSTALGASMAHVVTGAPLGVSFRREGDELVLDGRIAWASNLLPGASLMVTAAADDDGARILVAVPLDTPGVGVQPYPSLLALQSSRSSTILLEGVRVPASLVLTEDFAGCIRDVRPTFLALQSSFCWGLSRASLAGAAEGVKGVNSCFDAELADLQEQLADLSEQLCGLLRQPDVDQRPMRQFVQTRLDMARLTTAATRLELAARGGRAYRLDDPAGRRFREAAFLPIQAPTEGLLRWELAHSA